VIENPPCTGCSVSQVALARVLAQGQDIIPIPGTKHREYLEDNVGALAVSLSAEDLASIDVVVLRGAAAGVPYPEQMMILLNG
jgi:aryl-alcohol dehydrogenase-like predicted oxidoreductase